MAPLPVPPIFGNFLFGSLVALGTALLVMVFLKSESKTFSDIGLVWASGSLRRFLVGSIVGMAIVGLMLAVIVAASGLAVELASELDYWNAIGFSALVLFMLALMEEIAFCTYSLARLFEAIGVRTSIYCTSFFFALYPGLDPRSEVRLVGNRG